MPPTLRSGTMFCLGGTLGFEQRIYCKGDSDYGSAFTVVDTPVPLDQGGDDVYWGKFLESATGQSFLILAPRWQDQDETKWTIFGTIVQFVDNWPPHTLGEDIPLIELLGAGNVQAGIYIEKASGDVYLKDSAGAQAISLADPIGLSTFLIVAAVQLKDAGDSKLWVFATNGFTLASDTGTGNDFKTAAGLELVMKLQGQNHGGSSLVNPTLTLMMNPFVMDGSTDPAADRPSRVAGLFWTCSDGDATPPFEYDGTVTAPQDATAGVWSDTADESGGTDVEYNTAGLGGMNIVNGPLDDSRLGPSTKIFGGGICIHTDSDIDGSYTDVSTGRYDGAGSVQDRLFLAGATYGGNRNNHGTTFIVDNLVYTDNLVAGHRSNNFVNAKLSKINAMRGWALVDPDTFASGVQEVGPGIYQTSQVALVG